MSVKCVNKLASSFLCEFFQHVHVNPQWSSDILPPLTCEVKQGMDRDYSTVKTSYSMQNLGKFKEISKNAWIPFQLTCTLKLSISDFLHNLSFLDFQWSFPFMLIMSFSFLYVSLIWRFFVTISCHVDRKWVYEEPCLRILFIIYLCRASHIM